MIMAVETEEGLHGSEGSREVAEEIGSSGKKRMGGIDGETVTDETDGANGSRNSGSGRRQRKRRVMPKEMGIGNNAERGVHSGRGERPGGYGEEKMGLGFEEPGEENDGALPEEAGKMVVVLTVGVGEAGGVRQWEVGVRALPETEGKAADRGGFHGGGPSRG